MPFRKYFQCILPLKISVKNSETGTAIHTPVIPRIRGRISKHMTRKNRVLANDMMADTFPLDKAVNIPEDIILIPLNKKFIAKIRKPTDAS